MASYSQVYVLSSIFSVPDMVYAQADEVRFTMMMAFSAIIIFVLNLAFFINFDWKQFPLFQTDKVSKRFSIHACNDVDLCF